MGIQGNKGIKGIKGIMGIGIGLLMILQGSFAQKKPEWMKDPASVFDPGQVMVAIGSGKSQEAARKNAMEQLAASISASVEAETKLESQVAEGKVLNDKGKQERFGEMTETSWSQINVNTNARLFNVTTEYYTDRKGTVYAASWFPKEKTARMCETMIEDNNQQIEAILQSELNPLEKFGFFDQASRLAEENDGLYLLLLVLDPSRAASVPMIRKNTIEEAQTKLAREVTFSIRALNRDDGSADLKLANALSTWISGFGWIVDATNPRYILEAGISFTETSSLQDLLTIRWTLHLTVSQQGEVVGSFTKRGIQDHRTEALAKEAFYGKLPTLLDHKPQVLQHLFGITSN